MESEKGLVWALRKAEGGCVQRPGGRAGTGRGRGGGGEWGDVGAAEESGQALVAVLQASPSTSFVSTDKERCTSQLLSSRRPPGPWGWWRGPQSAPVISIFCAELSVHDLRRHFPPSPASGQSLFQVPIPVFPVKTQVWEHQEPSRTTVQGQAILSEFPSSPSCPGRPLGFRWLRLIPSCFRAGGYLLDPCNRKDRTTHYLA